MMPSKEIRVMGIVVCTFVFYTVLTYSLAIAGTRDLRLNGQELWQQSLTDDNPKLFTLNLERGDLCLSANKGVQERNRSKIIEAKRAAVSEAKQAVEDAKIDGMCKIIAAFHKMNQIKCWFPNPKSFSANPLAHKKQTLSFICNFLKMISPTDGLFTISLKHRAATDNLILVSDIPGSKFQRPCDVMLAARVIGKKSVELPGYSKTSMPQVSFKGVYFCEERGCADIYNDIIENMSMSGEWTWCIGEEDVD